MQQSPKPASTVTGQLISTFRHGKGFLVFLLLLAIVLFCMAGFVLYLGTILPVASSGANTSRGSSPQLLIYSVSGLLVVTSAVLFGLYPWQKKLRGTHYEVYEHGIVAVSGKQQQYTAFTEIEDLYLFSSGQTVFTGLITNLAYRRNESEPFHRVIESLKGFQEFQQLVRELHVRECLPVVMNKLESNGAVTFKYVPTGQVWRKRVSGDFLNVVTQTIIVTREFLEVDGRKVPVSALASVNLNAWSEKVTLKDEAGNQILSTVCTGIMSHDLFLTTLEVLLDAQRASSGETVESLA
ncbi:hypothetical protein KW846_17715 [Pseudomonas sp. PDM32]|jgi:hypothetical protein|uniref:hypothetical protein n=1 Tax=Pseudomonas sp. PDM32 TaxID=2854768 RepID=UPI001C44F6F2|nr:hypothetical protein [Pseudomonas sp. PDM32]MBV7574544.1 hypothetical protein [Pseudomonas sp. PDM32]